jgi:multicomponent K+:H+ antiporter subunit G
VTDAVLPAWAALPAGILLIAGGLLVVLGAAGLLRMPDFFTRMHPPTMGVTLGTACVLVASMLASSALHQRPVFHEFLIGALLGLTSPVTAMILTRAALARNRARSAQRRD